MDALCKNVSCDEWAMGPTGNCLLQKTTGRPVGSCPKFKADWPGADDPAVSVSRKGYESADEAGQKGEAMEWISVNNDIKPPHESQVLGWDRNIDKYEVVRWSETLKTWNSRHIIPTCWKYIKGVVDS